MSASDPLNLTLKSDPCELTRIRDAVWAWIEGNGWDRAVISDIVLAVDEALTNVIRHGYDGETDRPIEICVKTLSDSGNGEGIEIAIRDFGKQVPLDQIRGRDLEDLRPGGLGVHIIRSVMDFAEYSHPPGGGMQLVLRKFRGTAKDEQSASEEQP